MGFLSGAISLLAESYVEFPNLFRNHGLKLNVSDVAFTIGSFEIRWYGLLISGAVLLCIILGMRSCKKYGIEQNDLLDYLIFALPAAIIGLRVYYVAFNFSQYRDNFWKVFAFWEGGLAIYGGIIAAVIAVFVVSRVKKQKFLRVVDFFMGYVALGQAIGRWGNFFNQEAYGGPTTLPWGMTGSRIQADVAKAGWKAGTLVHPTFFYESMWCLIVFAVIMLDRRSRFYKNSGELLAIYMVLYGTERMLVEGLRTDSLYIGNTGIRVSQLLSGILVVVGIALFIDLKVRWRKAVYEGAADDGNGESSGFAGTLERLKEAEETGVADNAAAEVAGNAAGAAGVAEDAAAGITGIAGDAVNEAEKSAAEIAGDAVNEAEQSAAEIAGDVINEAAQDADVQSNTSAEN